MLTTVDQLRVTRLKFKILTAMPELVHMKLDTNVTMHPNLLFGRLQNL